MPNQLSGKPTVFQEARTAGPLLGVRGEGATVLLVVDGGKPIAPLVVAKRQMGIDQLIGKAFLMKLLTHAEGAESLAQALGDVGLGETLFAQ
jgi:hypothetical protein